MDIRPRSTEKESDGEKEYTGISRTGAISPVFALRFFEAIKNTLVSRETVQKIFNHGRQPFSHKAVEKSVKYYAYEAEHRKIYRIIQQKRKIRYRRGGGVSL